MFGRESLNDDLTDAPVFHDETIYTVSKFRKKLADAKAAEPYAIGFWKRKFNFDVGKNTWLLSYKCT